MPATLGATATLYGPFSACGQQPQRFYAQKEFHMSRTSKLSDPRTPVSPLPGGQGGIGTVAHVADNYSASPRPKPASPKHTCEGTVTGGHQRGTKVRRGVPCRQAVTLLTVEGGWRCRQHRVGLTLADARPAAP